jgi:hemoglobin
VLALTIYELSSRSGPSSPDSVGAPLIAFTAESFGGPDRFTRELGGFPALVEVHRHLKITEEQRQRFVQPYLVALDVVGMPDDEPFREAVRAQSSSAPRSP